MITACGRNGKADDPIGESGKTVRTENMLANLKAQADSGVYSLDIMTMWFMV